jgi:hypothetical protein
LLAKGELSILWLKDAQSAELGMDVAPEFQSKILSRKRTPEEYRVYRAGLEWDLTDPIVIERAEDFKIYISVARPTYALPTSSQ